MHSVIDLILRLEDLLEAEVVMALLKSIKGDVLVVLREHICAASIFHMTLDGASPAPTQARRCLAEHAVLGLRCFVSMHRRLRLRGLNAEAVLHG